MQAVDVILDQDDDDIDDNAGTAVVINMGGPGHPEDGVIAQGTNMPPLSVAIWRQAGLQNCFADVLDKSGCT